MFVGRRGKHLLLDFGELTFVVHLMQGGRLKPDEKQSAKPRFGQARWRFADGRALLLTEAGTERKAGVWVVDGDPEEQAPLLGLGPEADTIDKATLAGCSQDNPMRLHGFLRDQHLMAGMGRRLANEVCHRARLSPFANTAKLDRDDVTRLCEAIHVCINEGLAFERGLDEMSSSADRPAHVHNRDRRDVPRVRRRRAGRRVRPLHGRLLRHLPDRRQGPGRQHDEQVPQVGTAVQPGKR